MTDKLATPLVDRIKFPITPEVCEDEQGHFVVHASDARKLERDRAMLREALKGSPCYCEDADGDGDAVTCERCAALALTEDK